MHHFLLCLCLIIVKQHIVHDDICHHVFLQHLFPQVTCLISIWVHGVACALAIRQTSVEGHEERLIQIQSRSEEHLILIQREMRQAATILQHRLLRIALCTLVLLLSVIARRLVCPRILQFKGKKGNAIYIQSHIQLQPRIHLREGLLPCQRELVLLILQMR